MTASYAEDHTACEMLIEPERSAKRRDGKVPSLDISTVSEIIDELIPKWERGILLSRTDESAGAAGAKGAHYQNVAINRAFVSYLQKDRDETSATVIRKDRLCGSAIASQKYTPAINLNAADLHTRYGNPVAERYAVRPGVTLMVAYGADQAACRMVVEPRRSIFSHDEPDKYMRPELATEIIDEVLPDADRGDLLLRTVTKSGCNDYETVDYQNVTISRFRHRCRLPNPKIEGAATITRKIASCSSGDW
jgi:hypothetical protein